MPKVFNSYAKYYDLLYKEKNYSEEVKYVEKVMKRFSNGTQKILNLGCGTGMHDFEFAVKGYNVTGVEISNEMVGLAKERLKENKSKHKSGLKFFQGDMRKKKLNEKFDAVISLFHVISYQTSNEDIRSSLVNVKRHLKKGGIFIFDFWYGPAVLNEKPEVRSKKFESSDILIERVARPVLKINENIVDVNYKISFKEKKNGRKEIVNETHSMRYFFIPEISMLLENAGLKLIYCCEWMTGKELTEKSWSALAVAKNN